MKKTDLFLLCVVVLASSSAHARECRTDSLPETTPTSRFKFHGDTVTDSKTGLTWMRCAVGQAWNGKTCTGAPESVSWKTAVDTPQRINQDAFAGHSDWRLPVVPELASIIELQCFFPRVNTEVFPETPSVSFWTSMEKRGAKDFAYTLDFGGGEAGPTAKTEHGSVRLVRGGPWWTPPKMKP